MGTTAPPETHSFEFETGRASARLPETELFEHSPYSLGCLVQLRGLGVLDGVLEVEVLQVVHLEQVDVYVRYFDPRYHESYSQEVEASLDGFVDGPRDGSQVLFQVEVYSVFHRS